MAQTQCYLSSTLHEQLSSASLGDPPQPAATTSIHTAPPLHLYDAHRCTRCACIVFATISRPQGMLPMPGRPWGPGHGTDTLQGTCCSALHPCMWRLQHSAVHVQLSASCKSADHTCHAKVGTVHNSLLSACHGCGIQLTAHPPAHHVLPSYRVLAAVVKKLRLGAQQWYAGHHPAALHTHMWRLAGLHKGSPHHLLAPISCWW